MGVRPAPWNFGGGSSRRLGGWDLFRDWQQQEGAGEGAFVSVSFKVFCVS